MDTFEEALRALEAAVVDLSQAMTRVNETRARASRRCPPMPASGLWRC